MAEIATMHTALLLRWMPWALSLSCIVALHGCGDDIAEAGVTVKEVRYDTLGLPGGLTLVHCLYGEAADNMYAAGIGYTGNGAIWHFNGTRWTEEMFLARQGGVVDLWWICIEDMCVKNGVLYVAGSDGHDGVVLQKRDRVWTRLDNGGLPNLRSVIVDGSDAVCGDYNGRLYRFANGAMTVEESPFITSRADDEYSSLTSIKPAVDGMLHFRMWYNVNQRSTNYVLSYANRTWDMLDSTTDATWQLSLQDAVTYRGEVLGAHEEGVSFIRESGRVPFFNTDGRASKVATNGDQVAVVVDKQILLYDQGYLYLLERVPSHLIVTRLFLVGDRVFATCADRSGGNPAPMLLQVQFAR